MADLRYVGISRCNKFNINVFGYLIGDGGTTTNVITFTNADPEIIDRIQDIFSTLKVNDRLINTDNIKRPYNYRFNKNGSKWMTNFIMTNGLEGKLSKHKTISDNIFTASNDRIIAFLNGYFSTDGWVHNSSNGKSSSIAISSASEKLIKQTIYFDRTYNEKYLIIRYGWNTDRL